MRKQVQALGRAPSDYQGVAIAMFTRLAQWIDRNILSLGREMRLSYLPPLMVYMAYGISGLTGIVGTFFVKDYLGLSASFLAALGFWAGIPWALKMPIGHLVDLLWRWKGWLVGLGAGLLAASLAIMAALIGKREAMTALLSAEVWFVISTLLAPIGYVIQDAVADAMTVDAVPRVDERGQPFDQPTLKLMHTTMQTLGRVAIVGGGILVAMINRLCLYRGRRTPTGRDRSALQAGLPHGARDPVRLGAGGGGCLVPATTSHAAAPTGGVHA